MWFFLLFYIGMRKCFGVLLYVLDCLFIYNFIYLFIHSCFASSAVCNIKIFIHGRQVFWLNVKYNRSSSKDNLFYFVVIINLILFIITDKTEPLDFNCLSSFYVVFFQCCGWNIGLVHARLVLSHWGTWSASVFNNVGLLISY